MLRLRYFGAAIIVIALYACGGGSGTPPVMVASPPQVNPADMATQSYVLDGSAQTVAVPAINSCAGRVTLPPTPVAAGALLTLTTSLVAPGDAAFAQASVRPMASGRLSILCYVTFTMSNTVTFPTLPAFAVTVASTISTAPPQQFFYALSDPASTNVALSFRTEGPATVSGHTLAFAASPSPQTLVAGKHYIFMFYGTTPATVFAQRLYVANVKDNSISVFDLAHGNAPLAPIAVKGALQSPRDVARRQDGRVYVSDATSIKVYDSSHGNAVLPAIAGATGGIALDASGRLYVADTLTNSIRIFDTANGNVELPAIKGAGLKGPSDVAVDAGGYLFVANSQGDDVLVFDTLHENRALKPIVTDANLGPMTVAIDASGTLYVGLFYDGYIAVYDTKHGNARLPNVGGNLFRYITDIAIDSVGKLYVSGFDEPAYYSDIYVIDTKHGNAVLPSIPARLHDETGVAVGSNDKLYVPNPDANSVLVFDTAHGNAPLPGIQAGGIAQPDGLVVDAAGKLYVSNYASDSLSVFDTVHGNALLPPITGGSLQGPGLAALDASGRLYVTNTNNDNRLAPPADLSVFDTAHADAALSPINIYAVTLATGVAVNANTVYVSDNYNPNIHVLDIARGYAELPPISDSSFRGGMAFDQLGKLYVANTFVNRVDVFDTVHGNRTLPAITGLKAPFDVATDANGKLYVAGTNSVSVFDLTNGNKALPPITGVSGALAIH